MYSQTYATAWHRLWCIFYLETFGTIGSQHILAKCMPNGHLSSYNWPLKSEGTLAYILGHFPSIYNNSAAQICRGTSLRFILTLFMFGLFMVGACVMFLLQIFPLQNIIY